MATSVLLMTNGATPATPAAGKTKIFVNTSKKPAFVDDSGAAIALSNGEATAQSSPGDPTGSASATGLMMGLAGAITPATTGRILFMITGDVGNTNNGATATIQLYEGTGTAPVNGAAITGSASGGAQKFITAAAAQKVPFGVVALVTGLTLGTAYWFDVSLAASAGTSTIKDVSVTAFEI